MCFALLPVGVPQVSVFGPQLFSICATPLSVTTGNNNLMSHFYVDDTPIFIAVKPARRTLMQLLVELSNVSQKPGCGVIP